MAHRLLQRRLAQASARIRELREELRIAEDQLSHLQDETEEKSLRALVAETPAAEFEHREAKKHSDAMSAHRDALLREIAAAEARINDLLDRMSERTS